MIDYTKLATLAAVLRTGSFEAAAAHLAVTQSAVSQRIKNLEEHFGGILVLRETPTRATELGAQLNRHYEQVAVLERGLNIQSETTDQRTTVRIAVNADSLATWITPALAECSDLLFDIAVEDQDHSAEWLRRGKVVGAVTARENPVQGCDVYPLGALRYCASASPEFMERWFPDGVTDDALSAAPNMVFNQNDGLQASWIKRKTGKTIAAPTHWVPSTQGFVDGALTGLGWGMNPEYLIRHELADGLLVSLDADLIYQVPLFWQINRQMGPALRDLTQAIKRAAKIALQ